MYGELTVKLLGPYDKPIFFIVQNTVSILVLFRIDDKVMNYFKMGSFDLDTPYNKETQLMGKKLLKEERRKLLYENHIKIF